MDTTDDLTPTGAQTTPAEDLEQPVLNLGFIPLTDCAPLVVAKERGHFARHGLEVRLSKETSWANIRDKVAIGVLDGAQMLASMPIASTLGIGPLQKPMVTALTLDLNGNAITVSDALYRRMQDVDPEAMAESPTTARALRRVIAEGRAAGRAPLTFAMVFPVSTHNYQLRYWMASAGIQPDRDVRLVVLPPAQMVGALRAGQIDGHCVGEPWNGMAVRAGIGRVVVTGYEVWNNAPEKVFGVNLEWAEQHPNTHRALLMALLEACRWLDAPEHRAEAVDLIARSRYVNAPPEVMRMSMNGTFQYARSEFPRSLPDFHVFHRYAANFPWRSQGVWLLTQMLRWGHVDAALDLRAVADAVFRPDLYREAAEALGQVVPAADHKTEGGHAAVWAPAQAGAALELGPDRFFDGRRFTPADPVTYLGGFEVHNMSVTLEDLASRNPAWSPALQQRLIAADAAAAAPARGTAP